MKKSIIFLIAVILISPLFFACDNTKASYQDVNVQVKTFLTDTNNDFLVNNNYSYSTKINNARNSPTSDFASLVMYEQLAYSSLAVAKIYYDTFAGTPNNSASEKILCGRVVSRLNNVKTEIEKYNAEKQEFISTIDSVDINSNSSKNALREYKVAFGDLIISLNEFNKAFENAFTNLYGGITNSLSTSSDVQKALVKPYTQLFDAYIKYSLVEYDNIYTTITVNYYNNLAIMRQDLKQGASTANYSKWYDYYTYFNGEYQAFLTSIDNIDLKQSYENAQDKELVYYNQVKSFITTDAITFMNKTNTLL